MRLRALIAIVSCAVLVACGSNAVNPAAPTTPPVPSCQSNNTATVRFGNRSNGYTYDIIWDGSRVATVTPGQDSNTLTVAANVQHTLRFQYTNSSYQACTPSTPTPAVCSDHTYTCSF